MTYGVSEIVGSVEVAGGGREQVYRALRPLICASCGAAIEEGALFTRREHKGLALRIMPTCSECVPFEWPDAASPQRGDSELMNSLLTTPERKEHATPANDAQTLRKAESRLAPALSRSRRRDKRP